MSKIVYLLGAGASRGIRRTDVVNYKHSSNKSNIIEGLPLVNEIPERLNYWVDYLNNYEPNTDDLLNSIFPIGETGGTGYEKAIELLTKDLTWLKEECSRHATIDTFAKKLYLTNRKDKFYKVELLLTIFFILEQFYNKPDGRYDTFLASVLTKELELPEDINILTWNYDSQFEIAYREYVTSDVDYNYIHNKLFVYDAKTDSPIGDCSKMPTGFINPKDKVKWHNANSFIPHKIIKLNGTANFTDTFAITDFFKVDEEDIKLKRLLNKYILYSHSNKQNEYTRLSFAWDNQWYIKSLIENQLEKIIGDAEILVVIGYTFPFFNRETDRKIFEIMPNLSKIYIQDPNAINLLMNIEPVLSYTHVNVNDLLKGDRISPITNTSQFFLPPEL